ncbi:hypothetical protein D3C76_1141950 [compost metagenome]
MRALVAAVADHAPTLLARRQGIDIHPNARQRCPPLIADHRLSVTALEPTCDHQAVIQLGGQLAPHMVTTPTRPAHRHRHLYRCRALLAVTAKLDTGQRFDRRPHLGRGKPEVALAATCFEPQQTCRRQKRQVRAGRG